MERRPSEFGERRGSREATGDGKTRDFDNWERKGPLSPLPQPERQGPGSRDGSRPRTTDAGRTDSFRKDRRQSPASWGEGRQDGSRPPRREFPDRERPERAERVPSAAERDMQWRSSMRPDPVPPAGKSPIPSRDGSEAPPSPAGGPSPAPAPAGRPKLQLQKRTVSDSPDITSPAPPSSDAKPSPFGAARPIDTAAREREVEEKRLQAAREKKEAEERAKEERRLAREAAAREAAAKEAAEKEAADAKAAAAAAAPAGSAAPAEEKPAEGSATAEATKPEEATTKEKEAQNGAGPDQKLPVRTREPREPKEHVQNYKSRAAESGNWRSSSAEHTPREEYRGGRSEGRGEGRGGGRGVPSGPRRGSGPPRGPREGGGRGGYRANGGPPPAVQQPNPPQSKGDDAETVSTPTQDEDGWTTVPAKQKGRGQGTRPVTTA